MFAVTIINLSADAHAANSELGSTVLGSLDPLQLVALLQTFQQIDPVQNQDADPQIVVEATAGKFTIRTGQGRLFLYNTRDSAEAAAELDAEGIVGELTRLPSGSEPITPEEAPEHPKTPHRAIAIGILASGLLLNAYTVYSVFNAERANRAPAFTAITQPRERAAILQSASGRYATGDAPGDRAIEIAADGRVRFLKIALHGERLDSADTSQPGHQNSRLVLATTDSGLIEISSIDTVLYYLDPYRRTVGPAGEHLR